MEVHTGVNPKTKMLTFFDHINLAQCARNRAIESLKDSGEIERFDRELYTALALVNHSQVEAFGCKFLR